MPGLHWREQPDASWGHVEVGWPADVLVSGVTPDSDEADAAACGERPRANDAADVTRAREDAELRVEAGTVVGRPLTRLRSARADTDSEPDMESVAVSGDDTVVALHVEHPLAAAHSPELGGGGGGGAAPADAAATRARLNSTSVARERKSARWSPSAAVAGASENPEPARLRTSRRAASVRLSRCHRVRPAVHVPPEHWGRARRIDYVRLNSLAWLLLHFPQIAQTRSAIEVPRRDRCRSQPSL